MKSKFVAAALLAVSFVVPAHAAEPAKLWESVGFANPESVLWDGGKKAIYVSNVNGEPTAKDGNGYLSKLNSEGKVVVEKWVTGLDAPKGMAVSGSRLYVADIDRLVVVDTTTGKVTKTYPASGAKFLNDVTMDEAGILYVSDMVENVIWTLKRGKFEKWVADAQLESPNGLKAESGRLVVASWGPMTADGKGTTKPGTLKAVSIADRTIRDLSPSFGNLDGLEVDGKGGWLVSDWIAGDIFTASRQGKTAKLFNVGQGSADIGFIPDQRVLLVPMMVDGKVAAYKLP